MKTIKFAAGLVTALAVQAASAGVITIVIDDFNYVNTPAPISQSGWTTSGGGTWTWNAINPSTAAGLVQSYTEGAKFVVNTPTGVTYQASLAYATTVNYAAFGGTNGQLSFIVATSDQSGNSINGSPIPALTSPLPPLTFYNPYASGGAIELAFNGAPVKAWDASIDQISVTFDCASQSDGTFASLAQFLSQTKLSSCVPVPGSLSLLGLGGVAAALMVRRRKPA